MIPRGLAAAIGIISVFFNSGLEKNMHRIQIVFQVCGGMGKYGKTALSMQPALFPMEEGEKLVFPGCVS